jgi:vancomycin resistance protein YoaR
MRAEAGAVRPARERLRARTRARRPALPRRPLRVAAWVAGGLAAALFASAVAFAGSRDEIAPGVRIAGVAVGGLESSDAETLLARKAARSASVPIVFTAGRTRWSLRPEQLDLRADWRRAVADARAAGDAPWLFRGVKRLEVRLFGAEVQPRADVYEPALRFYVDRMADAVRLAPQNAAIVLRDLRPAIVPSRNGRALDPRRAERVIVASLAGFSRRSVPLPVRERSPAVTTRDLDAVADDVRTALSAPVRFGYNGAHWRIHPRELATFLLLPREGRSKLRIGGPEARSYFARLSRAVDRKPRKADYAVTAGGRIEVVPGASGRELDVAATEEALLAAAVSPDERNAGLVVRTVEPELTTREARSYRITRVLSSFATPYAGDADRIKNLQLAVSLLDGTLIAPGDPFSFNDVVGPRTKERGFRPAPIIMNGEYEEGVGGGVSQVATTVFNAAWEAGLKITERTAHDLYISRYPLGRDATVNFPDIDLQFMNDTGNWLFMRAVSGETGIAVTLLGAPTERKVVSNAGPLREVGPPRVKKILDPTLFERQRVVVEDGEPARSITVTRKVTEGGKVLYSETWTTTYRSEAKTVRVGTLTRPAPPPPPASAPPPPPDERKKPAPPPPNAPGKTTTAPTETTPTTTGRDAP